MHTVDYSYYLEYIANDFHNRTNPGLNQVSKHHQQINQVNEIHLPDWSA